MLAVRQPAYLSCCVKSVQMGHLHIHDDQRVSIFLGLLDGLETVFRRIHCQADFIEQEAGDFQVDRFVVDQQDATSLMVLAEQRFGVRIVSGRCAPAAALLAKACGKPEEAANAGGALDAHFPAHQLDDPLGNRQPEAGAAVFSCGGVVGLFKGVEQPGDCFLRDADTGIVHLEAHHGLLLILLQQESAQKDTSLLGKLDRVRSVIEQCLLQTRGIALQICRKVSAVGF